MRLGYRERFKLELYTLEERIREKDFSTFKLLHGLYDINMEQIFVIRRNRSTVPGGMKGQESEENCFQRNTTVDEWNKLSEDVANTGNIRKLKRMYDTKERLTDGALRV